MFMRTKNPSIPSLLKNYPKNPSYNMTTKTTIAALKVTSSVLAEAHSITRTALRTTNAELKNKTDIYFINIKIEKKARRSIHNYFLRTI
jgi:hypothetical protein